MAVGKLRVLFDPPFPPVVRNPSGQPVTADDRNRVTSYLLAVLEESGLPAKDEIQFHLALWGSP